MAVVAFPALTAATDHNDADEWVLIPSSDDDTWIVADGDEGFVSAVIFGLAAASFGRLLRGGRGAPSLSFFPSAATAAASSRGRVLLRAAWSRYFVCDPEAGKCDQVPPPRRPHSMAFSVHLALVADPDDAAHYFVACFLEGRFEIYSSVTGVWREVLAPSTAGVVVAGGGVAFASAAYWKTTAGSCILALDVASGGTRHVSPPPAAVDPTSQWQLGVAAGQVCCAVTTAATIDVYGLTASDRWEHLGSLAFIVGGPPAPEAQWRLDGPLACGAVPPRPLRFESEGLEVLLRVGEGIVAVDLGAQVARAARLDGATLPERDDDIVPYVRAGFTF